MYYTKIIDKNETTNTKNLTRYKPMGQNIYHWLVYHGTCYIPDYMVGVQCNDITLVGKHVSLSNLSNTIALHIFAHCTFLDPRRCAIRFLFGVRRHVKGSIRRGGGSISYFSADKPRAYLLS